MTMVAQARKMFEEKIARHRAYRDRLVCENAPPSQIEFVERCVADLEKLVAAPCEAERAGPVGRDGPNPGAAED